MLRIEFAKVAEKGLGNIEKHIAQRILKKIRWLAENAEYINHESLTAQFRRTYKLRVGEYRVVYTIERNNADFLLIH